MGIKNLYDAKPVALYILGKKAEGDLKRPFKAGASMFGGALSSYSPYQYPDVDTFPTLAAAGAPATDAAAIAEAEKRIGAKKDE